MYQFHDEERAWMRAAVAQTNWAHSDQADWGALAAAAPAAQNIADWLANVTARLRDDCRQQLPRIAEDLCAVLAPVVRSGVPAASMVEFSPVGHGARERFVIPRGSRVAGRVAQGNECIFSTTSDVVLRPVRLVSANLESDANFESGVGAADGVGVGVGRASIVVNIETVDGSLSSAFRDADPLRLHASGSYAGAATVYAWLVRYCERVEVFAEQGGTWAPWGTLAGEQVQPAGFEEAASLLTLAGTPVVAPTGMQHAVEYMMMPAKFLCVDVSGLGAVLEGCYASRRLQLRFILRAAPDIENFGAAVKGLRLHCSPVVNLFVGTADPFIHGPVETRHLLRASAASGYGAQVHRVLSVVAQPLSGQEGWRFICDPVGLDAAAGRPPSVGAAGNSLTPRYRVERHPSGRASGVDTYVALLMDHPSVAEDGSRPDVVVSVDAELSHAAAANALGIGDISLACARSPSFATFENFHEVTPAVSPPAREEAYWHMLEYLRRRFVSPCDRLALQQTLLLAHALTAANEPRARSNAARCASILAIDTWSAQRWMRGGMALGTCCDVQIDERAFVSVGDVFVFLQVLRSLMRDGIGVNRFLDLRVELVPSRRRFRWSEEPNRAGRAGEMHA